MSLDGIEKWKPWIDEEGIVHPTIHEQLAMLRKAQRQWYFLHGLAAAGALLIACGFIYQLLS